MILRDWSFLMLVVLAACDRRAAAPAADVVAGANDSVAVMAATPAPRASHVALDGEGIRIITAPTGATRLLAFGSSSEQAIAAVSQVHGQPAERAMNMDCGAGPMEFVRFPGGMILNVQEDRLVGWTVRPGSAGAPTTMSGIGLGSTRAQLASVYTATVEQSTIGTEFSAGAISGVMESAASAARITDIWAGLNCIAR